MSHLCAFSIFDVVYMHICIYLYIYIVWWTRHLCLCVMSLHMYVTYHIDESLQYTATHSNALQHIARHFNILQHTAAYLCRARMYNWDSSVRSYRMNELHTAQQHTVLPYSPMGTQAPQHAATRTADCHTSTNTFMYIFTYIYIYICTYTFTYSSVCIYFSMYVYM